MSVTPPLKRRRCEHNFVKSFPPGPRDNNEFVLVCRNCGAEPETPAAAPPANAMAEALALFVPAAAGSSGASPANEEEVEEVLAGHQANLQALNPLVLDLVKTMTKQQVEIFDLKKQVESFAEERKRAPPLPPFVRGDRVQLRKGTIKGIDKMVGEITMNCPMPASMGENMWNVWMPNGKCYIIHETDIIRVQT